MIQAEIARKLVETNPSLLLPSNHDKLHDKMVSIYHGEHAVTVTLTEEEVALARMIATTEDDLPQA
jgi:hypothetical protein